MVSPKAVELCTAKGSVSEEVARDPSIAPHEAASKLFNTTFVGLKQHESWREHEPSEEDLQRALKCGNWGSSQPSPLFLRIFADVLRTLDIDPLASVTSPSLIGSNGVVPLTIIAPLPDICRHMSNLIARAEHEVFLATNYWMHGEAASLITNSLLELSRRAEARGRKAVVKIMYDRGNPKQLLDNHQSVPEKEFTGDAVRLPPRKDMPGLELEVVNFHRPIFGTFHAKYMVVDRRYAVISSNNIQDNDNVEMMAHLEGDIVDSFYDLALICWHNHLKPPLPMLNSPAKGNSPPSFDVPSFNEIFQKGSALQNMLDQIKSGAVAKFPWPAADQAPTSEDSNSSHGHTNANEDVSSQSQLDTKAASGDVTGVNQQAAVNENTAGSKDNAHLTDNVGTGSQQTVDGEQAPSASANGNLNSGEVSAQGTSASTATSPPVTDGTNAVQSSDSAGIAQANSSDQHQKLPEHSADSPHYDNDIASEVYRSQSVLTPQNGESYRKVVTRHLNTTIQKDTTGDAPDGEAKDRMIPMLPLPKHDPVPMAMVCRKPWGAPDKSGVHFPQNEAWLSAIRHASESVFIQSPDVNAEPLIPALIDAAKRGVQVVYYFCLGYNDMGELLPAQGGHNEYISNKIYSGLDDASKQNMHIYNYIAKDQTRPIHNSFKKRSCHVKLMIVDNQVAIQGNGNQDTQSWYHSLEANVMIDSQLICTAWLEGIRRNQNTHLYGAVSKEDGCWHGPDGQQAEHAIGNKIPRFSWLKGVTGAIKRVQGAGGF